MIIDVRNPRRYARIVRLETLINNAKEMAKQENKPVVLADFGGKVSANSRFANKKRTDAAIVFAWPNEKFVASATRINAINTTLAAAAVAAAEVLLPDFGEIVRPIFDERFSEENKKKAKKEAIKLVMKNRKKWNI